MLSRMRSAFSSRLPLSHNSIGPTLGKATVDGVCTPPTPIPNEHRATLDLSSETGPDWLVNEGNFGENCVLAWDRRYESPELRLRVTSPRARKQPRRDVRIEIGSVIGGVHVNVIGMSSTLRIGYCKRFNCNIDLGMDSLVEIGDDCTAGSVRMMTARGVMRIGRDCMISGQVIANAGIHHALVDIAAATPKVVPQRMNMAFGDHVWLGQSSYIVGKAQIGSGSVIGAASIVAGRVPANAVAVGNPAVVKKTDITWAREPDRMDEGFDAYMSAYQQSHANTPSGAEQVPPTTERTVSR